MQLKEYQFKVKLIVIQTYQNQSPKSPWDTMAISEAPKTSLLHVNLVFFLLLPL